MTILHRVHVKLLQYIYDIYILQMLYITRKNVTYGKRSFSDASIDGITEHRGQGWMV